ncbi:MAG: sulfatase-like hydrolase/transferase [candidate division KSB1 bacterium]|nr:sulfatase-like hydrolase/transferase [candidate division KSB1 bacterium]MDZ7276520.1 sulfatase-like hydrolase/transferase [candidate division KSB1 bacterium]MDZ7286699.1 sulfatase-like hydrolase/transferase [candidate division KSB1 bacterium]MDZ7300290.1 sulfatase-like hydrolase/transferase [candidate division KSB1 bacterium]MDZ7307891.1 sulfatase-like hydrolase/transferase [candidate division KSB1 bacterium]
MRGKAVRPSVACVAGQWSLLLLLLLSSNGVGAQPAGDSTGTSRPNFLIIITDDQRFDSMEFMPKTKRRIFEEGLTFTRAYVTTPLCCPSRASILTGMYAHKHGVRLNEDPLHEETFVVRLHEAGYYTGFVGKYLNSYTGLPRPEFDFWAARKAGHSTYFDPVINFNGVWQTTPGYVTYVLRDYALAFLDSLAGRQQPFLLFLSHTAPHAPVDPAPEDTLRYPDLPRHRPPSYDEADVSDKPRWIQALPRLTRGAARSIDQHRRRQLQCLYSVDQANDSLLATLARRGLLDNTVVFFLSDNGFHEGEHRLVSKWFVYEEAIRIPFAVRYPPLISPRVERRLVANIDIAPTVLELAGLPISSRIDGRSLTALMRNEHSWREDLLIEGWPEQRGGPLYAAIHTGELVYVENQGDRAELYDLRDDPYQLHNLINSRDYAAEIQRLRQRLHEFRPEIETSVELDPPAPGGFVLFPNHPNPVQAATEIRFALSQREPVTLEVYDLMGRKLLLQHHGELGPGNHSVPLEMTRFPNGTYFYRLATPTFSQTRTLQVVR